MLFFTIQRVSKTITNSKKIFKINFPINFRKLGQNIHNVRKFSILTLIINSNLNLRSSVECVGEIRRVWARGGAPRRVTGTPRTAAWTAGGETLPLHSDVMISIVSPSLELFFYYFKLSYIYFYMEIGIFFLHAVFSI